MEKFEYEFNGSLSNHISVLIKIRALTEELERSLRMAGDDKPLFSMAIQMAQISIQSQQCIMSILQSGFISEAHILLRWSLELAHKAFYLAEDPSEYERWISGQEIRPSQIGNFIQNRKFPPWKSIYDEWSDIIHGNYRFVRIQSFIGYNTPANNDQLVIVGQALRNLMIISHKMNSVLCHVVQPYLGSDCDILIAEYNALEDEIVKIHREYDN